MSKKVAVVLFNLGGPDSLKSVKPFLFNLFYDKAIINLPNPFRWALAKLISSRREDTAKKIYQQIGNKSPILDETKKQSKLLEQTLNKLDKNTRYKVFISMRYWKPLSSEAIKEIKKNKYELILLLPLYPQFSTTTTGSSIEDFWMNYNNLNLNIPVKSICCYFDNNEFINSHVDLIKKYIKKVNLKNTQIIFSAHSLPEKIIKKGDPYKWQVEKTVEKTVEKIVKELNIKNLDYIISYQSKVGPLKWIGPNTEEVIIKGAKEKKGLVIVPIAFVSEHSETLVELDLEYKDIFLKNGGENFVRIPTLSENKTFIEALAKICLKVIKNNNKKNLICSEKCIKKCPKNFIKCINNYG